LGRTADYRGRVLSAVQDVEDGLSRLHHLGDEAQSETHAAEQAGNVEALAMRRYERGAVSYLDVVNAQTTALRTRQKAIEVDTQRLDGGGATAACSRWRLAGRRPPGRAEA
jgi:outer membrane protein TolC